MQEMGKLKFKKEDEKASANYKMRKKFSSLLREKR